MKNTWMGLVILLCPLPAVAADDPSLLAAEAIRANPGVEAMRARAEELAKLAEVAGTWRDPSFGIEYLNAPVDSFRIDDSPMSGLQFQLKQKLPEWGWSKASKEVARRRSAASRHGAAEAEVQLRRNVEQLFWRLSLSNMLREVTREHLERTSDLLDAVRTHYEVGHAGQSAVLRLTILRDRLADDLGDFERADRKLSAGLNQALARPQQNRFETPLRASPLAVEGGASAWLTQAKAQRPELARIREEVEVERRAAELARISIRPDFDLWFKYRLRTVDTPLDDGTDFITLGVSLPIPWNSRKRGLGEEAARLEGARGARARLASALDAVESELIAIEATWQRAHEKATRYHEALIPAAHATLEMTLSDFSVGRADFSSLYESEVTLLQLEKTYLAATIETHLQRADARATVGLTTLEEKP
ncbi:MAG: TolC family protein [Deltaproteobacteria bacterium]|nr:TolC family protein [Deltaproteobacteria bacterium]MBW2417592.1 TolC family protein [Deltaproteobacteria bacterium]